MQLVSLLELAATIYAGARWAATHQILWFSQELAVQQFIIIIMAHNINCIIILLTCSGENHNICVDTRCMRAGIHRYVASSGNVRVTNCIVP